MTYDAASQMSGIARFADLLGQQSIATSSYAYDLAGKLTRLTHRSNSTVYADYQWTYDAADRITQFVSPDGMSDYSYDNRGQLTGANNSSQLDEAYSYDANGNRTNIGYQTGANNQLLRDGTYSYTYDNEGNRTSRTNIATGEVTLYSWDYHNRLTSVVTQNSSGTVVKSVAYIYDAYDRRIAKVIDPDGAGPATATTERMVYDGDNIALTFDGQGNQTHRYLYGSGVDQILADETPTSVNWALVDHQGTVRDVVDSNGAVLNHLIYDSYGQVTSETNPSLDFRFGYTGRERDKETGLQYNRARYYDPRTGAFIGQDPIGFGGGDANLYRYVGNSPTLFNDPTGLTGQDIDWNRTAVSGLQTFGTGLIFTGAVGIVAVTGLVSAPVLATVGVGLLGVSALSSYSRRSQQAADAGNGNLGDLFGAVGLDTFGLNGLVEGTTGRELVSGRVLCTDERSDVLGQGVGNLAAAIVGGKIAKATHEFQTTPTEIPQCFVAGTLILTNSGKKPIEALRPGDLVVSWDEETGQVVEGTVTEWYEREAAAIIDIFVGVQKISCTTDHPFWVEGRGWVLAFQLKEGMALQNREGERLVIDVVRRRDEVTQVFNVEIDGLHTYFVSDLEILSHNMCGDFTPPEITRNRHG